MVGRDRELGQFTLLLDEALAGPGRRPGLLTAVRPVAAGPGRVGHPPSPDDQSGGLARPATTAVVTLWQSKAHKDRFEAEQLLPAFQVMGMTDVAVHSNFTAWETGELFIH